MRLSVKKDLDTTKKLLVLGWFSDDEDFYKNFNPAVHKKILSALKNKSFSERLGSTTRLMINDSLYEEILVVSMGSSEKICGEGVRRALSKGVLHAKSLKLDGFTTNIAELAISKNLDVSDVGLACGESCVLSNYTFNKYSSKSKDEVFVKNVSFSLPQYHKKFSSALDKGSKIGEATNYAKELVNEPACVVNPSFLETEARKLAKDPKINLKVLKKKDLEKKGMNLILAVGKGSVNEPRVLVIDYRGSAKKPEHVILGKGVTFDSGGYNIKPTGYMEEMKYDMAGAAAVFGVVKALTLLKPRISASFVIPLAENMISSKAYRPSDIIKAMNGKTVEVLNTDAEGRLILADALSYATEKYKGSSLIDVATLTGATVIALGHVATSLISNDSSLTEALELAGHSSGDRVWELPFFEDYHDFMDSDIADVSNISKKFDRSAGVITGGVFLSKFVGDAKWAHLDIGGTAFLKEPFFYNQKYATGSGVRVLTYFLNKL